MLPRSLPKVSVVLPSYNHEKYVIEAIQSIENQSYCSTELVILDDASTDSSSMLIKEYCKDKPHTVILKDTNSGVAKTLNEGIKLSTGDYIAFFASDDIWHPDKLKAQVDHLTSNPTTKICFTEGDVIDDNGNVICEIGYSNRRLESWDFNDVLMEGDLPAMSPMVRLADIKNSGGFPEMFAVEDFAMWCSLLQDGGCARVIRSKLCYYRMHGKNTHILDTIKVLRGHFEVVEYFTKNSDNKNAILHNWRMKNANHLARHNKREALRYFLPCIFNIFDYRYFKIIVKLIMPW